MLQQKSAEEHARLEREKIEFEQRKKQEFEDMLAGKKTKTPEKGEGTKEMQDSAAFGWIDSIKMKFQSISFIF